MFSSLPPQHRFAHLLLAIIAADRKEFAVEGQEDAVATVGGVNDEFKRLLPGYRGLLRSGAEIHAHAEASNLSYTVRQAPSFLLFLPFPFPLLRFVSNSPPPSSPKFSTTRPTWSQIHQQRICGPSSVTGDAVGGRRAGEQTHICPFTTATPRFSRLVVIPARQAQVM
eukprot:751965-Hanusia_phi.AAC.1